MIYLYKNNKKIQLKFDHYIEFNCKYTKKNQVRLKDHITL